MNEIWSIAFLVSVLAAAIPALVGYNLLVRQLHRKETRTDLFISRVIDHFIVQDSRASRQNTEPRRARSEATL